jgi:hypothetical protein
VRVTVCQLCGEEGRLTLVGRMDMLRHRPYAPNVAVVSLLQNKNGDEHTFFSHYLFKVMGKYRTVSPFLSYLCGVVVKTLNHYLLHRYPDSFIIIIIIKIEGSIERTVSNC